jgi:alkyl hydroperoxide reductase subunit AhpC
MHYIDTYRINLDRKHGGLGGLKYPLLSDFSKKISSDYDVLIDKAGIALRGLFLIDPDGVLRQITINDLPVGRSVDETLRLVKAFQFVEKHGEGINILKSNMERILNHRYKRIKMALFVFQKNLFKCAQPTGIPKRTQQLSSLPRKKALNTSTRTIKL